MTRVTRAHVDALAEVVDGQLFPEGGLCPACQRRGVDAELWAARSTAGRCTLYVQGAYGGYSARVRHADTGESDLGLGYVTLREVRTFLAGMRAALLWKGDQ